MSLMTTAMAASVPPSCWPRANGRLPMCASEVLTSGTDVLALASINVDNETGAAMHAEAQRILALAGQAHSGTISLGQVQARLTDLHAMPLNGDGILNPAKLLADAPGLYALAQRIMDDYSASTGCDGRPGLGPAALAQFFADVKPWPIGMGRLPPSRVGWPRLQALAASPGPDGGARPRWKTFLPAAVWPRLMPPPCNPWEVPSAEGYALLGKALHAGFLIAPLVDPPVTLAPLSFPSSLRVFVQFYCF